MIFLFDLVFTVCQDYFTHINRLNQIGGQTKLPEVNLLPTHKQESLGLHYTPERSSDLKPTHLTIWPLELSVTKRNCSHIFYKLTNILGCVTNPDNLPSTGLKVITNGRKGTCR